MAKLTIGFGVVLILLGIWGFVATGSAHPTALLPTWFGLALAVCGLLARSEDEKRRMLWMHAAAVLGLVGFLGAGAKALPVYIHAHGAPLAYPIAVADQLAMALICLVFVLLCVRSFIAVRRTRKLVA
jgi:fucose 4-O-acetylase-like acetyltransferase